MDVGEAEQSELREHQDADSGAEVTAVDRDQELEEKGGAPSSRFDRMAARRVDNLIDRSSQRRARDQLLRGKQQRRAQNQIRNGGREPFAGRVDEEIRADDAAD